ncbi:MAG: 4-hydroxythreonine-4-phosphate dehydrogenase PdxA [Verrucomicrobia bacterium]|nr:4-hydroxythreonine-4-phosphate dehydrogenase PdxA [Verrucomicrobiota bacterium]
MKPWIGITLGDLSGIGPEVALRALSRLDAADDTRYLLIGDGPCVERLLARLGLKLGLQPYDGPASRGRFFLFDPKTDPMEDDPTPGSATAALAALSYLTDGAMRCLNGELDALVTAPLNKEAIIRTGRRFIGQTEFLSELAHTERTAMMLLGDDDRGRWLRVALATTHLPLKHVPDQLTQAKVEVAIDLAARACQDLDLGRARIGVCGLNPHAGEGGQMGTEEISVIAPAVRAAQQRRIDAVGPLAADSLFYQAFQGEYDAVVAMYHDQGLVPLKMIGFERGINWTLGLPFIRTSPDHGTAYDIAGQGKANPSSMLAAITLAKRLVRRRAQKSA